VIGAMLASTNAVKPCGFFLAGINDDRLSVAYKMYHPPGDFLNTPIWLSSGTSDQRASYGAHERVRAEAWKRHLPSAPEKAATVATVATRDRGNVAAVADVAVSPDRNGGKPATDIRQNLNAGL